MPWSNRTVHTTPSAPAKRQLSPTGACCPATYALTVRAAGLLGAVSAPITFTQTF